MPKAIFVSLVDLYPQLSTAAQHDRGSKALRNVTCGWWEVNPLSAADVQYAFGVFEGAVVSAHAVNVPANDWPVMPQGAIGAGRRYIPAAVLTDQDWATATSWRGVTMFGPVRYGTVSLDSNGALEGYTLPPS